MAAVDEKGGGISGAEVRPYADVAKGYTYFAEGDVLFAKITPCMQNGKHAIARDLLDGIGFGSTEFHVMRPGPDIMPDWLHYFLIQPRILRDAVAHLTGAVGQQRLPASYLAQLEIPLPPLAEQRRIVALLAEQMAAVERARSRTQSEIELLADLAVASIRESLTTKGTQELALGACLAEVTRGVGPNWREFRVIGATRAGLAPAKEQVGKQPERYKLVEPGMIFYNPMRILLGSIAMVDEEDEPGITSPDYVVVRPRVGILHPLWFYTWFRSHYGEDFIKQMTRGAVRERLLFRRLARSTILLPSWEIQLSVATKLRLMESARRPLQDELELLIQLPASILKCAFSDGCSRVEGE